MTEKGFDILPGPAGDVVDRCLDLFAPAVEGGGIRRLFERFPSLVDLLGGLRDTAQSICCEPVELCRSILFDKTAKANWKVGWHQDVTMACPTRFEKPGWTNWSVKDGVPHVQPPEPVLEGMITIRLHLDPCGVDQGPLRILPGSHRMGRLKQPAIDALVSALKPVECLCDQGEVLVMKPLLVHSSGPALTPNRRRVVHLEFCPQRLLPPEFKR